SPISTDGRLLKVSRIVSFTVMASAPSKQYSDDVSLVMVLLDTNPFFWGGENTTTKVSFSCFLNHVISFLNSVLLLNQLNQVVIIATGYNSCDYIFDSSTSESLNVSTANGKMPALCSKMLQKLEEFVIRDEQLSKENSPTGITSSLLSGSLSLALCYIQKVLRSGRLHPNPRVPIDSCIVGVQHSAFLQQASYITGGVYLKPPQLDGLFQYLSTVFATDLHSRSFCSFLNLCFCHKSTIDMGYICSVCLSIFCKQHKKCSTCGSVFGQANAEVNLPTDQKRKALDLNSAYN
ncbi:hypothetical protein MKX01_018727, partial [Papaver californicum]